MSIGPGQPISPAVGWAQEWQRLSWTVINQAMGHYLHGCANVAMARTPQQALAALHKTQTSLLRDSADTVAQVTWLWRKQNTELFVIRVEHAPALQSQPAQATPVEVEYNLPPVVLRATHWL
jgi:hypothetical protein